MSTVNDNPSVPTSTTTDYVPDSLIAGGHQVVSDNVTIVSGQGVVARGTLLGKATLGTASSAAKAGGNTGGGTLTLDVSNPVRANAEQGVYTVRCIAIASNSGTFEVKDPSGESLGQVVVGATFDDKIKFVLADVGTDFALGDGFDVTVAAGSGKFKVCTAAAIDGTQYPAAIAADTVDATSADKIVGAYFAGEFNSGAMTFGAGITAAAVKDALRALSIYLKTALPAADPS